MLKNLIIKNNGTALLMTMMILTSVLVVALGIANLVVSGIKMNRVQTESVKAYYATEAGLEYALWTIMKDDSTIPLDDELDYSDADAISWYAADYGPEVGVRRDWYETTLSNGAEVSVLYASTTQAIIFRSIGIKSNNERAVEVRLLK
ncbi:MAG: hypothetical protein ABH830_03010 [Patescibacteria group bacterium]